MFYLTRNCWFCNKNSRVSFFKRNNWYCQHCTQYNGFTKDGDYNKPIHEMHMNEAREKRYVSSRVKQHAPSNCLCDKCNMNQEIKLRKLSNYEAKNDANYDIEIKFYKEYLEKLYDLCDECKSKVKFEIRKQDGILKQYLFKLGNYECFFEKKMLNKSETNDKTMSINATNISKNSFFVFIYLIFFINLLILLLNDYLKCNLNEFKFLINDYTCLFMYIINYTISFTLIFINSNRINQLFRTIFVLISLYNYYTNDLNTNSASFLINGLLIIHLIGEYLLLYCLNGSIKIKYQQTQSHQKPLINKQMSFNALKPQITTTFQQATFTRYFNDFNSFEKVDYRQPINKIPLTTVSLFNFNQQKQQQQSKPLSFYTTSFACRTNNQLIKPPKLNYSSDQYSQIPATTNYFSNKSENIDDLDDDSSSIISGMTNLYLEKSANSDKNSSNSEKTSKIKSFNVSITKSPSNNLNQPCLPNKNNSFYIKSMQLFIFKPYPFFLID